MKTKKIFSALMAALVLFAVVPASPCGTAAEAAMRTMAAEAAARTMAVKARLPLKNRNCLKEAESWIMC